jgi:hypothetical protein
MVRRAAVVPYSAVFPMLWVTEDASSVTGRIGQSPGGPTSRPGPRRQTGPPRGWVRRSFSLPGPMIVTDLPRRAPSARRASVMVVATTSLERHESNNHDAGGSSTRQRRAARACRAGVGGACRAGRAGVAGRRGGRASLGGPVGAVAPGWAGPSNAGLGCSRTASLRRTDTPRGRPITPWAPSASFGSCAPITSR